MSYHGAAAGHAWGHWASNGEHGGGVGAGVGGVGGVGGAAGAFVGGLIGVMVPEYPMRRAPAQFQAEWAVN